MSRGPARLLGAGLGWLAGTGWQLQAAAVAPAVVAGGWLAAALAALVLSRRLRRSWLALCVVAAVLGWSTTTWRAGQRLQDRLLPALEGETLTLEGGVRGMPQVTPEGVRFDFEPERPPPGVPSRLRLGWWRAPAAAAPLPAIAPGERWRLVVRLRQVHGLFNPEGFDQELQWFEQGIGAGGSVSAGVRQQAPEGEWVSRLRVAVREGIRAAVPDASAAGLLVALSIGDQGAIERSDWSVFRVTGVAHLVAISGMHVTMFAWLAAALVSRLWRCSGRAVLWCPARVAARWGGVAAATGYALLAGWGVPAQRTVWMLVAVALLRSGGRHWSWPLVLGAAGWLVVLIDPWALLQPGFWLSFIAVAVLMADGAEGADEAGLADRTRWRGVLRAVRTQVLVSLALAPLSLLFFQQVSIVGLAANLVAIPLVSFVITPLALGGVLWSGLWVVAALVARPAIDGLAVLSQWRWAAWQAPVGPAWWWCLALLGLAFSALPWPRPLRWLGVVAMLPVFLQVVQRPPPGEFTLLGADVGQGNAVLIRTATHDLLYDTGPQYGERGDAGERVLLPLLRAQGVERLDLLVLSHRDSDHTGGAASVLRGLGVARVLSSLETGHPLRRLAPHQPCAAGQRWHWDGVLFEVLHPEDPTAAVRSNARSCVLKVSGRGGAALLTGDIEALQELRLVHRQGAALAAQVLLVPHHGSKTSSLPVFVHEVHPKWALVQAGYRNRFHHPAPSVVATYEEAAAELIRTDLCGAWHWSSADGSNWCARHVARRYWHAQPPGAPDESVPTTPDIVWP